MKFKNINELYDRYEYLKVMADRKSAWNKESISYDLNIQKLRQYAFELRCTLKDLTPSEQVLLVNITESNR
jgi:hypothetical protein